MRRFDSVRQLEGEEKMAIDLKKISDGKQPREPRVLIYGPWREME